MEIEFDPAKNEANLAKHGVALADFAGFDAAPVEVEDGRFDYGETRIRAFGRIGGVAHCLVYSPTDTGIRLISLRRAHEKELHRYE